MQPLCFLEFLLCLSAALAVDNTSPFEVAHTTGHILTTERAFVTEASTPATMDTAVPSESKTTFEYGTTTVAEILSTIMSPTSTESESSTSEKSPSTLFRTIYATRENLNPSITYSKHFSNKKSIAASTIAETTPTKESSTVVSQITTNLLSSTRIINQMTDDQYSATKTITITPTAVQSLNSTTEPIVESANRYSTIHESLTTITYLANLDHSSSAPSPKVTIKPPMDTASNLKYPSVPVRSERYTTLSGYPTIAKVPLLIEYTTTYQMTHKSFTAIETPTTSTTHIPALVFSNTINALTTTMSTTFMFLSSLDSVDSTTDNQGTLMTIELQTATESQSVLSSNVEVTITLSLTQSLNVESQTAIGSNHQTVVHIPSEKIPTYSSKSHITPSQVAKSSQNIPLTNQLFFPESLSTIIHPTATRSSSSIEIQPTMHSHRTNLPNVMISNETLVTEMPVELPTKATFSSSMEHLSTLGYKSLFTNDDMGVKMQATTESQTNKELTSSILSTTAESLSVLSTIAMATIPIKTDITPVTITAVRTHANGQSTSHTISLYPQASVISAANYLTTTMHPSRSIVTEDQQITRTFPGNNSSTVLIPAMSPVTSNVSTIKSTLTATEVSHITAFPTPTASSNAVSVSQLHTLVPATTSLNSESIAGPDTSSFFFSESPKTSEQNIPRTTRYLIVRESGSSPSAEVSLAILRSVRTYGVASPETQIAAELDTTSGLPTRLRIATTTESATKLLTTGELPESFTITISKSISESPNVTDNGKMTKSVSKTQVNTETVFMPSTATLESPSTTMYNGTVLQTNVDTLITVKHSSATDIALIISSPTVYADTMSHITNATLATTSTMEHEESVATTTVQTMNVSSTTTESLTLTQPVNLVSTSTGESLFIVSPTTEYPSTTESESLRNSSPFVILSTVNADPLHTVNTLSTVIPQKSQMIATSQILSESIRRTKSSAIKVSTVAVRTIVTPSPIPKATFVEFSSGSVVEASVITTPTKTEPPVVTESMKSTPTIVVDLELQYSTAVPIQFQQSLSATELIGSSSTSHSQSITQSPTVEASPTTPLITNSSFVADSHHSLYSTPSPIAFSMTSTISTTDIKVVPSNEMTQITKLQSSMEVLSSSDVENHTTLSLEFLATDTYQASPIDLSSPTREFLLVTDNSKTTTSVVKTQTVTESGSAAPLSPSVTQAKDTSISLARSLGSFIVKPSTSTTDKVTPTITLSTAKESVAPKISQAQGFQVTLEIQNTISKSRIINIITPSRTTKSSSVIYVSTIADQTLTSLIQFTPNLKPSTSAIDLTALTNAEKRTATNSIPVVGEQVNQTSTKFVSLSVTSLIITTVHMHPSNLESSTKFKQLTMPESQSTTLSTAMTSELRKSTIGTVFPIVFPSTLAESPSTGRLSTDSLHTSVIESIELSKESPATTNLMINSPTIMESTSESMTSKCKVNRSNVYIHIILDWIIFILISMS